MLQRASTSSMRTCSVGASLNPSAENATLPISSYDGATASADSVRSNSHPSDGSSLADACHSPRLGDEKRTVTLKRWATVRGYME